MKLRAVNIGLEGSTPKKVYEYDNFDPPSSIIAESDTQDKCMEFESISRPKTSRGKREPTPDEFADYIVPSSSNGKIQHQIDGNIKEIYFPEENILLSAEQTSLNPLYKDIALSKDSDLYLLVCSLFGTVLGI